MKKEEWRFVVGYEGLYMVSNFGRVKSLGNDKSRKEKILKPRKAGKGYLQVGLYKDVKVKWLYVHRLVWIAFNGPIPNGMVINHKDQNPLNCNLDNLMLCTNRENLLWGDAQERRVKNCVGKNSTKWVLKLNKNNEILHFYPSLAQAERETGIKRTAIGACCRGKIKIAGTVGGEKYIWKYAE